MSPFADWLVDQAWNRHPVIGLTVLAYFALKEEIWEDD